MSQTENDKIDWSSNKSIIIITAAGVALVLLIIMIILIIKKSLKKESDVKKQKKNESYKGSTIKFQNNYNQSVADTSVAESILNNAEI